MGKPQITNVWLYCVFFYVLSLIMGQAQDSYRYYRFTPVDLRDDAAANSVQLAEIEFQVDGVTVQAVAAENPNGSNPGSETPPMAIDGELGTKWLDFLKGPLIVDLGSLVRLEQYRWATANDALPRDPVRWTLEGSVDKSRWELIDDRSAEDFPTPTARFTFTEWLVPNQLPEIGDIKLFTVTAENVTSSQAVALKAPGEVVVKWSVENASSVRLSHGDFGILPTEGERTLTINADTALTLTAVSPGGEESITIQILFQPEFTQPWINEILAGSSRSGAVILDDQGDASDWIELFNPNPYGISLSGYGLVNTTDPTPIWYFPEDAVLEAASYGIIFASGTLDNAGSGPWNADFQLALEGEPLALVMPDGSRTNPFGIGYPEQFEDISYGRLENGAWDYFVSPTPGQPNGNATGLPLMDPPVFGDAPDLFRGSTSVALSTEVANAQIRYTLNGSVPTASSTLYQGPIQLNNTTTIRARLTAQGKAPGPVISKTFTEISSDLNDFTSNLPIILLDNFGSGGVTTGTVLDPMHFAMLEPDTATGVTSLNQAPTVAHRGGFKRRGSSTINDPKGNYRIEFWDEEDRDESVELLGLSNHADWVLFAPYRFDRSLVRIPFIHRLSNNIGLYASKSRLVEVFLNDDDLTFERSDYVGVYVLQEQISRDNNRVDIARLGPEDTEEPGITGGFILSIDRPDPGTEPFRTTRGTPTKPLQGSPRPWLNHIYPKEDDLLPEQVNYIKGFLDQMEDALYGPNFTDPITGYRQYLDVRSFVDYHILNVLTKDPDALRLSTYMNKDRSGPLKMGPIWDYDRTMGNDADGRSANPEGWDPAPENAGFFIYDWWGRLFEDPDFWQDWIDRWQYLRETEMSNAAMSELVQFLANQVEPVQQRNFDRWPEVSPNGGQFSNLPGWPGEVEHLENWLIRRANWMDSQFPSRPEFTVAPGRVDAGVELSFLAANGDVYYTVDGTDPRLPGGGIHPEAVRFASGSVTEEWVSEDSAIRYRIPQSGDSDVVNQWMNPEFDDTGFSVGINGLGYDETTIYDGLIATDVILSMNDQNTSAWIRIPFEIQSLNGLQSLQLQIRYDDGFIAYINGTPVASANASGDFPGVTNAGATGGHSDVEAMQYVSFNISLSEIQLSQGENLLAIHGLNDGITSSDFLIQARLVAEKVTSSDALTIQETTTLTARAFDGTQWSSMLRGSFWTGAIADVSRLLISEIHYRPAPASLEDEARGFTQRKEFEFLELYNPTDEWMDVSNVRVTGGVTFDFSSADAEFREIAPRGRVVLVDSVDAFRWRHAERIGEIAIAGTFDGALSDEGEELQLQIGNEAPFYSVTYGVESPWPTSLEDVGFSLVYLHPEATPLPDPDQAVNWIIDTNPLGSPGAAGPGGQPFTGNPDADLNQDGLPDFLNYVFGYPEEVTGNVEDYLVIEWVTEDANGQPVAEPYVEVRVRSRANAVDAVIQLETSTDLNVWDPIESAWSLNETVDLGSNLVQRSYRSQLSGIEQGGQYLRVVVLRE